MFYWPSLWLRAWYTPWSALPASSSLEISRIGTSASGCAGQIARPPRPRGRRSSPISERRTMTPVLIDNMFCPYSDCGMAVEATDVRFFHSSTMEEPNGHTCVIFYQCVVGHRWQVAE